MNKKILLAVFSILSLFLYSCGVRGKNSPLIILPEGNNRIEDNNYINIDEIIETQGGKGNSGLPDWLLLYNYGGNEAVERMEKYFGKYCFVGRNESFNFEALTKWADNYPETNAFTRLAAARIEKRMTSKAALYPDDEYGVFYERFIKKAYDTEYPSASLEETFWIKKQVTSEENGHQDTYEFFTLICIDKTTMQEIIRKIILETDAETNMDFSLTRAQINAINNIKQHFFEGF